MNEGSFADHVVRSAQIRFARGWSSQIDVWCMWEYRRPAGLSSSAIRFIARSAIAHLLAWWLKMAVFILQSIFPSRSDVKQTPRTINESLMESKYGEGWRKLRKLC